MSEERLVADVDSNLKSRAKADPRSIKEIVNQALEREFSTAETAAVERRIDEKETRITNLQREINEREREMAKVQDELGRLRQQLENYTDHRQDQLDEARDALEGVDADPENPAVKNWAGKLGMTPVELVEEL